ncbi:NAD(P)-binding protein [Bradyrhizobium jicamae]|uniref:NAD(P)-binding protein n=1 Tax=Bradyrhizobium jicamae TaxID=280332 RepID=UPI001BADA586|nr:NAD(P)-binding protein [Bradyrhizobium jicamae]MBR0939159.1 NAD(P)-binding protein [Bradyrhizobium jicamae]
MAKIKIAILGGGIGSLAAAFDLTEQDPDGSLYDITLYQVGWRLGGKCSVGWTMGADGEVVRHEHGLHVWAGFYDNAFDLLQRCYEAMENRPDWRDAFEPLDYCWVEEWLDDAWSPWRQHLAPNGLTPGLEQQVLTPHQLWTGLLNLISQVFYASNVREVARQARDATGRRPRDAHVGRVQEMAHRLATDGFGLNASEMDRFLSLLRTAEHELFEEAFADAPTEDRRAAILINMGLALLTGMLDGNVLSNGFDGLDDREWSAWLEDYGAWSISLDSALARGFYDYVFGVPGDRRQVGAGTGTRALLRLLFAYKGSFFYAMNMAMGDFLIAPLYKVLSDRQVKFKFFSRVDRLLLTPDRKNIDCIEIGIQIEPSEASYDPLVQIGDISSWPDRPKYHLLNGGTLLKESGADLESPENVWPDVGKEVLWRNQDFDVVVLGISVGALKTICTDLADELPAWRDLLENIETTPTMAMQLWSSRTVEDYGWSPQAIATSLFGSFTTWGDNSILIESEQWPSAKPASLAYFVGNCPDPPPPDPLYIAKVWRRTTLPFLWDGYDDGQLSRPPYVRINIYPSDQYVLSVPGSLESRLRPDGSGLENLFLAGDWVRIGLNAGCVEQAVLGGRAAARAITGVDMNSQYDTDFGSQAGFGGPSIEALGVLSLLPDIRRAGIAGTGFADACCVVGYFPRAQVEAMLPLGLRLDPRPSTLTPRGHWPLALMFVRQRDVRPGLAPPLGGLHYNEFVVAVPSVQHTDRQPFPGPFCYMPTILLDSLPPLLIGVGFYGLKKRTAKINARADSFDIRFDRGSMSAVFSNGGLPGKIQDFPLLATIRRILGQIIIGETSTGSWVYSYLDHNFDAAEFQPVSGMVRSRGKINFDLPFVGLPDAANAAAAAAAAAGGPIPGPVGFRLLTEWKLTYPITKGHFEVQPQQPSVRAFASAMGERFLRNLPMFGRLPPR